MKKLLTCLMLISFANGLSSATPVKMSVFTTAKCIFTANTSTETVSNDREKDAEPAIHPLDILGLTFN